MKILAFADVHGSQEALDRVIAKSSNADVLLCAGDLSNFEHGLHKMLGRLAQSHRLLIIIPGNHEGEELLRQECARFEGIIYLHRGLYRVGDVCFVGYGGGGFSEVDRDFENFVKKARGHMKGKVVLVTHAPPYGTKLDKIYGEARGCKSIRDFIIAEKPVLAVSGHLHENDGVEDYIGKTHLINPGKKGRILYVQ